MNQKMKRAGFLFIFPLVVLNAVAQAERAVPEKDTTLVLTIDGAVERAMESHVDIQRAKITLGKTERESKHAWNQVLPSISANGSAAENGSWHDIESDTVSASAGVSASLSVNTGLAPAIRALKSSYEAGKISFEDTVRSAEVAVRKQFYHLLYLQENLETSQSTLESYQKQYDQTSEKYRRGVVPEIDLLTAQVNLETARPDVDSARSAYSNSLAEFIDTLGIEPGTHVELSGSLDDADGVLSIDDSVLDGCAEKSAAVQKLEQDVQTAKLNKNATRNSLLFPSLNLGADVNPLSYSYNKKTETSSQTPDWRVSVGISLPLESWLPGSSARDKIAALDDTVKDCEIQLADLKKTVRTNTAQKLDDIRLSQKTLEARRKNVALAEKSYTMTEEAYRRGTKDLLSLQTAIDTLRSAQLQLRSEQFTLLSNVLDLENALSLPAGTFTISH